MDSDSTRMVEEAVLAVLTGTPLQAAAAQAPTKQVELAEAVECYRAAGFAALRSRLDARDWLQVHVEFADWAAAERIAAAHVGPALAAAETAGTIASWWFTRKSPCWRLRLLPGRTAYGEARAFIRSTLDGLSGQNRIVGWRETVYEPEALAFGGPDGMEASHRLFHADSRSFLDYFGRCASTAPPERRIGRREVSVLLCGVLMRGAGQEWYEQADIWHRVEAERPLPAGVPLDSLYGMRPALRRLMAADTGPRGALMNRGGRLAEITEWADAFGEVGRVLGERARDGRLRRGVRAVLAHHIVFHWNRLGLPARTQGILARGAREAVMES